MMPCKIYVILLLKGCILDIMPETTHCVLVVSINISLSVATGMEERAGGLRLPIKHVYHDHALSSSFPRDVAL